MAPNASGDGRCSPAPAPAEHQGLLGWAALSQSTHFIVRLANTRLPAVFLVPSSPLAPLTRSQIHSSLSADGESGFGKQVHKSPAMLGNKNRYGDEWGFISLLREITEDQGRGETGEEEVLHFQFLTS